MKENLYCINCNRTLRVEKYRRVWCPCNPSASYVMQSRAGDRVINSVLKGFQKSKKREVKEMKTWYVVNADDVVIDTIKAHTRNMAWAIMKAKYPKYFNFLFLLEKK